MQHTADSQQLPFNHPIRKRIQHILTIIYKLQRIISISNHAIRPLPDGIKHRQRTLSRILVSAHGIHLSLRMKRVLPALHIHRVPRELLPVQIFIRHTNITTDQSLSETELITELVFFRHLRRGRRVQPTITSYHRAQHRTQHDIYYYCLHIYLIKMFQ